MDAKKIVDLLDAMSDIVDSSHEPWQDKKKAIQEIVKTSDKYQLALGEFLTWFEEEDEEDEEDE